MACTIPSDLATSVILRPSARVAPGGADQVRAAL